MYWAKGRWDQLFVDQDGKDKDQMDKKHRTN